MENELEAVLIGGGHDEDVEAVIIQNILGEEREQNDVEPPFNLDEISEEEVLAKYRFRREHIYQLVEWLGIPNEIRTANRTNVNGVTAMCILLNRLAYPNRLIDLRRTYRMRVQRISEIVNHMLNLIRNQWQHVLQDLRQLPWLNYERMIYYSQAVRNLGGAVPNCWGFIDGTARAVCRPSLQQEEYFSGHKRYHCVKYQSVLCLDGVIVSLKGAYPGRRHDAGIFRDSQLYAELEDKAVYGNEKFVLYGDQAYGVMELLLSPFRGNNLPPHHQQFNNSMKVLRTSVEWGFQKVVSLFAFVDYEKNQKLLLQDVESMYMTAVLLTNIHTCLYSSQTAQFFNIVPPSVEQYLGLVQ